MFANEPSRRRRARKEVDLAIHCGLRSLAGHRPALSAARRLYRHVRAASELLRPASGGGRPLWHDAARFAQGISALAREVRHWKREPENWQAPVGRPLCQFRSLAEWLFGGHPTPSCLTYAWLEEISQEIAQQRVWFRHLAAGHSARGLDLPIETTRSMARLLLEAPAHLTFLQALEWSRWRSLGLDAPKALDRVDPARNEQRPGANASPGMVWKSSGISGFRREHAYGREWHVCIWSIRELLSERELKAESDALKHCVRTYAAICHDGKTSIWSLRRTDHRGEDRPQLTIEVSPQTRTIIQARGKLNRGPTPAAKAILLAWASQAGLHFAKYL